MKMKRFCSASLAALMLSSSVGAVAADVYVNGEKLESGSYVIDDAVYVSLEEVGEALGASVTVDENTQDASLKLSEDDTVVKMIEKVSESVVAIVGNYSSSYYSADALDYNELYAHGAGVVIDEEGMILTNHHVIDEIQNLTVIFGNGETYSGKVLYSDEESDLAVVKINKSGLKPISFAEENSLKVGQTVVAIGTPLSVNLINSASKGIVSGIGVNISEHYLFTQSDVSINGGNSGGPLVNLEGELVGINSMKYAGSDVEGMSFSIPVDTINYVLDSFENYGRVVRPDTKVTFTESWESKIGVPTTKGLTVTVSDSEVLLVGDMITHVNGYEVHSIADYNEAIKKSFNGESITFTYTRAGVSNTVDVETEIDITKDLGDRVEISFVIGQSVIVINGNEIEVEAPYVAGDGTTLVPLRVISEAFGAGVVWVEETQEIIIEYPGADIKLTIGSEEAVINEEVAELPVCPALSDEGVTMVPLRFISEAFGATVTFDGETNTVTVVKEGEIESDTISFSTELPRIGDSYHGWSMLTPTSMMMTDRALDGTETIFYDESGYLAVVIEDYGDDYEDESEIFDEAYDDYKNYTFSGMTLSRNEKGEDSFGNKTFRITGRSKSYTCDMYAVVSGTKVYAVEYICDVGSTNTVTLTSILESFKLEYAANDEEKEQTYDLSNVDEDGYRLMENEDLKVSFRTPADFSDGFSYYYSSALNELYYSNDDSDYVELTVYSKSDTVSAQAVIEEGQKYAARYMNPNLCTVSEVESYTLTDLGENAYTYSVTSEGLTDGDYVYNEVCFELGSYVYVLKLSDHSEEQELYTKLMESFTAKEISEDDLGVVLYEAEEEDEENLVVSNDTWSFELDSLWTNSYTEKTYASCYHGYTGGRLYFNVTSFSDTTYKNAKAAANGMYSEELDDSYYSECESVQGVTSKKIGNTTVYTYTIKVTYTSSYSDYSYVKYNTTYVLEKGRNIYAFQLSEYEHYANGQTQTDVEDAIASLTVN